MQTISFLLFRLLESRLGSQDILSEKPWKLKKRKKNAGIIFTSGEKATYVFCVNHPLNAIWSGKNFHKSILIFFF